MASVLRSHPVPFTLGAVGVSSILIECVKKSRWYSHQYSDLTLMRAILNSPRGATSVSEIARLKRHYSLISYKLSAINALSKCTPRISVIAFAIFCIGLEERIHKGGA